MEKAELGALGRLVEKLERRVADGEDISIGMIQAVAGQRAAGPLLLFPALIVVSPLSIIPGLPSLVGISTVLVAGQIALGRQKIWLPEWLTERRVPAKYAARLVSFLKPVSAGIDSVARRRFSGFLAAPLRRIGAVVCVVTGAIMPALEFIPFSSTVAAVIIATFALAITARDGMLALAWMALLASIAAFTTYLVV